MKKVVFCSVVAAALSLVVNISSAKCLLENGLKTADGVYLGSVECQTDPITSLAVKGDVSIGEGEHVSGDIDVVGAATIYGAEVKGDVNVIGDLGIKHASTIGISNKNTLKVTGAFDITDHSHINSKVVYQSSLFVRDSTLGSVEVKNQGGVCGELNIQGASKVGDVSFDENLKCNIVRLAHNSSVGTVTGGTIKHIG